MSLKFLACLLAVLVVALQPVPSLALASKPIGQASNQSAAIMPSQNHKTQQKSEFVQWCMEHAIRIDSLDGKKPNQSTLDFLDKALEGKRIVYLGEPDHYIQEKYDYRLFLINFLVHRGWTWIGEEMGRSDGARVNQYIKTGDSSCLARVGIYGYRGALNVERDGQPKGRLHGKLSPAYLRTVTAWVNRELWFAKQLRIITESNGDSSQQLHFFGFDVDVLPGGAYEDIQVLLQDTKADPTVSGIFHKLERNPADTREQEIKRLDAAIVYIKEYAQHLTSIIGSEKFQELMGTLSCLRDSLQFISVAYNNPNSKDMNNALALRELTMFRQMDEILSKLGPTDKVILIGHNMHMSKDSSTINFGKLGKPDPPMWPSIGSYLNDKLKGQIYSFWLLYDHGRHTDFHSESASAVQNVYSKKNTIESSLAKAGQMYLLPLTKLQDHPRSALIQHPIQFGCNGNYASGKLINQADCIVFIDEVSPPADPAPEISADEIHSQAVPLDDSKKTDSQ